MPKAPWRGGVVRLVLSATILVQAGQAGAAGAPPAPLALAPCRLAGLEHDALCGVLPRPLDPARPVGPRFGLHVAVLPALARQKLADPILFFAGGPGQSAIGLAGSIATLLNRLGARRDIVLIDQRGTGHSAPLQCDAPSAEDVLARSLDRARLLAAVDACRIALQKLPWGDLRFFTTALATADADAVRAALGADRVDLVGISYGTRAALDYLRSHPRHVRRVVIDGVAPPDMALPDSFDVDGQAALAALFRDCAADPACSRDYPALAGTWQQLLASLPRTVDSRDPGTGNPLHLVVTPDAAADLVRPALYTPALGAILPYAISQAAAGRFDVLLTIGATQGGTSPTDLSEGEHFSVICSEDVPRSYASTSDIARPASGSRGLYRSVCARWPRSEVPAAFYTIPASPVPVLLLSGGLDPVTPPRHAQRVARALGPKARAVVVANNGHGVMSLACMRDAVFRFIDLASEEALKDIDMSCAATTPRPAFFLAPRPAPGASAVNDPRGFGSGGQASPPGSAPATRPVAAASTRP